MSLEKFTKALSKWKKASEDNEKITRKLLEFYEGQSEKGDGIYNTLKYFNRRISILKCRSSLRADTGSEVRGLNGMTERCFFK